MPAEAKQEEEERASEWSWRFVNLRERGFDYNVAFALADRCDIVHEADRLLEKGCSPFVAGRILL